MLRLQRMQLLQWRRLLCWRVLGRHRELPERTPVSMPADLRPRRRLAMLRLERSKRRPLHLYTHRGQLLMLRTGVFAAAHRVGAVQVFKNIPASEHVPFRQRLQRVFGFGRCRRSCASPLALTVARARA
jgi:hypothetical protein